MHPFSPDILRNPYPMYEMMRKSQPVTYIEPIRSWSVFRYDHVRTVLSDYANFSSDNGGAMLREAGAAAEARQGFSLISTDPPRHNQLRSLVSKAFTPRAVAALEPRIRSIANELLDAVNGSEAFDLVLDFSYPMPVIVIAELLGIPSKDRDMFKIWSDEIVASADSVIGRGTSGSQAAHEEMNVYFRDIIAERRKNPADDLVSALVLAEEERVQLSESDILGFCKLLLVAGNETTTNLIGNAVLSLLDYPDQLAKLREKPGLLSSAIEEVLRFRSPVQAMFRTTVRNVDLGGQTIPAGSRVVAWIGSANRDEEVFDHPERFDIERNPNPHIAFGNGVHFCLGAPLARLEAMIALETLLKRFSHLERVDREPLMPARGFIVHGVTSLPLKFTARS